MAKGKRLNVLGFLNTDNDLTPFCVEGSVTSDIVTCLRRCRRGRQVGCFDLFSETITKKTVVIIDNAPIHTSQAFQKRVPIWKKTCLRAGVPHRQEGLDLYFLPGYAPELNLIEILWRFIKYWWLPFSAYLNFRALVEAVEDILVNVGSKYKIAFQ